MEENPRTTSNGAVEPDQNGEPSNRITPELVRQVADRVYTLILEDLRIENERRRMNLSRRAHYQGGKWYG